eukprot:gene568-314_t
MAASVGRIYQIFNSAPSDILGWKDRNLSALALILSLGIWYGLISGTNNVGSTCCYFCALLIVIGAAQSKAKMDGLLPLEQLLTIIRWFSALTEEILRTMHPVLTWQNPGLSALIFLMLLGVSILGSILSYSLSILFLVILAFTIVPVYRKNQQEIHSCINMMNNKLHKAVKSTDTKNVADQPLFPEDYREALEMASRKDGTSTILTPPAPAPLPESHNNSKM